MKTGLPARPIAERFWPKVVKTDGCWFWIGATDAKGYGRINSGGKTGASLPAHRVSYELRHGSIPSGLYICHSCDNPSCVNPDHFFLGSLAENNADMRAKKRHAFGERIPNAKLTEDDIGLILSLRDAGLTHRAIAERFNVSRISITDIFSGRSWKLAVEKHRSIQ